MYIWKIGELKAQLSQGELSEPEAFKYLMANTVLYSLAAIQYFNPNHYDTLSGFLSICIAVIGVGFIYKCNGGENGKHIIHRYLSVGWVVFEPQSNHCNTKTQKATQSVIMIWIEIL